MEDANNKKSLLKLNLGCGLIAPNDWINIDSSYNAYMTRYPILKNLFKKLRILPKNLVDIPWPENIHILNLKKKLPFASNSVQFIYSSHLIEHIPRANRHVLLRECYRVLVTGGVIRIIVPDLQLLVKKYLESCQKWDGNSQTLPPAETFVEDLQIYDSNVSDQPWWLKIYKRFYDKNSHKWLYDEQSLKYLLKATHFKNICERKYGESLIENVTCLDLPERFEGSICIEAIR